MTKDRKIEERSERAEEIFGADEKGREAQEANKALREKRSERPSTLGDKGVEGRFGSPD